MSFRVVIPARYASARLPGKVLVELAGKTLIQRVWEQAQASGAAEVIIATDDELVANTAASFGADVCMTAAEHSSGTDRIAEVTELLAWDSDCIIVNVQGDAPLIPPGSIRQVAELLADNVGAGMATLCVPITSDKEYANPNVVKVVFDVTGQALYFSRASIPAASHGWDADSGFSQAHRHIGLYAYTTAALRYITAAKPCELEKVEHLEQLRALWLGMDVRVAVAHELHGPDIDTADDVGEVLQLLGVPSARAKAAVSDLKKDLQVAEDPAIEDPVDEESSSREEEEPEPEPEPEKEEAPGKPTKKSKGKNKSKSKARQKDKAKDKDRTKTKAKTKPEPGPKDKVESSLSNEIKRESEDEIAIDSGAAEKDEPEFARVDVRPATVLLVCMGNICRSPTAEGVLRKVVTEMGLHDRITLDSAGTHAYHVGSPPDRRAIAAAGRRNIDLTPLRARVVEVADFDRFDYILAMDQENVEFLLNISPASHRYKVRLFMDFAGSDAGSFVPDPYYGGSAGFEKVLDLLEEAAAGFVAQLSDK